jgi:hypothetical protein
MKIEHAKQIVEFLESEGTEASLYEGYSGRFMYGKETAGVVTKSLGDVAYALGALGIRVKPKTDSMGLDIIAY